MDSQNPPKPPTILVFWIIWFAILQGLVVIQFFVGGGIPKGADQGNPPGWVLAAAGGLALAALAIRFTVIPKIQPVPRKLPLMIIGLALSEAIGFLGMFLVGKEFPTTRLSLLVLAIACIVSLAPVYAKERAENGRF
jgi:drug/metabolite transporter (DMT)-like permease